MDREEFISIVEDAIAHADDAIRDLRKAISSTLNGTGEEYRLTDGDRAAIGQYVDDAIRGLGYALDSARDVEYVVSELDMEPVS